MKRSSAYYYRKLHRHFGLIIGIQFIFWTIGGAFFAWSNMDQIHGDTNRKAHKMLTHLDGWVSPSDVIASIAEQHHVDSLMELTSFHFMDHPYYRLRFYSDGQIRVALANAHTGKIKEPLSKNEAEQLATEAFAPDASILKTEYVTEENVGKHHEYRGRPLPAYAVHFNHKSGTKVYVSTEYGEVMTFRNSNWRIFDFLWMMHTMDYWSRDNFGNVLIRTFSILGMITILTGFILFFKTQKKRRKTNSNI